MKDMHSHLLYGIDDGSRTIEESITLLKQMEKAGITELILTPHYVENSKYNCNNKKKQEIFLQLRERAQQENIHIKLHLGNEVFFSSHFLKLLRSREITTLAQSRYLLFEFPLNNMYLNAQEVLMQLVSKECVPVLAHPERYRDFQKNPSMVTEFLQVGVQLQGNFTTLFGKYGKTAEKTLKFFLKKKWIAFLGSDTHHEVHYNEKKLRRMLLRITKDKEYVEDLLNRNFDKVLKDEEIAVIR